MAALELAKRSGLRTVAASGAYEWCAYESAGAWAVLEDLGARLVPVHRPSAGDLAAAGSLLSMWEAFGPHAATLTREVAHAFDAVDVLVTPTFPFTAVGRDAWIAGPPDTSWATRAFSLTGHPALTLPCGFDRAGLPVALQIVARRFDESTMFRVGHAYEGATAWHRRRPDPTWWTEPGPSSTARARGAVGVVLAAPCRDVAAHPRRAFPVFATGATPRGGVFGERGEVQVPVVGGGLAVHPGDAVVGDENGVVVVPAGRLSAVLAAVPGVLESDRAVQARWIGGSDAG